MLSCEFNQTKSMISIGTSKGFRIYKINQEEKENNNKLTLYQKDFEGGLSIVEMYYDSNLLILVGGGKIPAFPKNKVILWDEEKSKITNELVFNNFIKSVKVNKTNLFISTDVSLHILNLLSLQEIDIIDLPNSNCQFTISKSESNSVLCYPHENPGSVVIKNYNEGNTILIQAHKCHIGNIILSDDGFLLATASITGKIIKLFQSSDGRLLGKLRVTKEKLFINENEANEALASRKTIKSLSDIRLCSLGFKEDNSLLSVSIQSNTCTEVLIFDISSLVKQAYLLRKESVGLMKFNSFKIKEVKFQSSHKEKGFFERIGVTDSAQASFTSFFHKKSKSITCFNKNSLFIVSSDGMFYEAEILNEKCKKNYESSLGVREFFLKED